jgi:hypothetical protein
VNDPAHELSVVVVVQRGQQRAAAAAIAAGHADYPAFRYVFPDPRRRARVLLVFFEATVRDAIPFGSVLAVTGGDRVEATAVWLPPGRFPWTPSRKLRATPAFARIMITAPRSFPTFMVTAPRSKPPITTSRTGTWSCSRCDPIRNDADSAHVSWSPSSNAPTARGCRAGSRPRIPPTCSINASASRSPTRRSQPSRAVRT